MSELVDRAAGALVGLAAGDALGAGYEFGVAPAPEQADMIGGGLGDWAPGEWTDDTQLALCIAEVAATGALEAEAVAGRFLSWFRSGPGDLGIQTRRVLSGAAGPAEVAASAAAYFQVHPHHSAGNGSLMRTAPVALAHLGDDAAIAEAAMEISALTHGDPQAGEACLLWCIGIDRAVRQGRLEGVGDGLDLLAPDRRDRWVAVLEDSRTRPPSAFTPNGYVVTALQAAHAAVVQTPVPDDGPACRHLERALRTAVAVGDDTDTVAAIAGQLVGARWGVSAVPLAWRRMLHGWPGHTTRDLVRLGVLAAKRGRPDPAGWPASENLAGYYDRANPHPPVAVALPDDPGLVVGNVAGLPEALNDHDVDAVVSLCRMGGGEVPDGVEHLEVMLVDREGANPNLDFVLADTVEGLLALRAEDKRVFLHCVAGTSRTPAVAAAYLCRRLGIPGRDALDRVRQVIDHAPHNNDLLAAVRRLPGRAG